MFDNLKNLAKLQQMQAEFKKERLMVEKKGVMVEMNGNFEVEEIKLNPQLGFEDQQHALKEALNEARESIQKKLAQKMMASGMNF